MLRTTAPTSTDHWAARIDDESLVNVRPGVFTAGLNARYAFDVVDQYPEIEALAIDPDSPRPWYVSFGVHDSVEAFLDQFGEALEADPRELLVLFTQIRRDEQYADGGWRWHKWGPMLGEQVPTTEYLYDEPDIESVVVFRVHEIERIS